MRRRERRRPAAPSSAVAIPVSVKAPAAFVAEGGVVEVVPRQYGVPAAATTGGGDPGGGKQQQPGASGAAKAPPQPRP